MCSRVSGSLQQRIVEQIDLPDREVVRRAPPGVHQAELVLRERIGGGRRFAGRTWELLHAGMVMGRRCTRYVTERCMRSTASPSLIPVAPSGCSDRPPSRRRNDAAAARRIAIGSAMVSDIFERRRDQAFPTLTPAEIDRLRRFGTLCRFAEGDLLIRSRGNRARDLRHPRGRGRGDPPGRLGDGSAGRRA